jgi:predicted transcriptional regulator
MAAELPFHLQTLPPEALDIIRFFDNYAEESADPDEIARGTGLSERGFSKAIKRLVTKGYAEMLPNRSYQLTDMGLSAADELAEYDENAPQDTGDSRAGGIPRRLVVAAPSHVVANQPATVYVGFDQGSAPSNADMVIRVSAVHGSVAGGGKAPMTVSTAPQHAAFTVTPEAGRKKLRLRVQAFQLGPNPDDINENGGFYVDVDIAPSGGAGGYLAYASDVPVMSFE